MSLAPTRADSELVARATALIPLLRENARQAEEKQQVPDENFEAVSEAGIFRMCVPKRFGGLEADFQTQCDALAELARGCPSTSWVATIFSAMGWLAGTFPDEAQEEIFASGDPRISGAFSPTGTLTPRDGGFALSGRWGFNTGCHGARWTFLNAILPTDDGEGVPIGLFAESSDLAILDDWQATGMAGTGSNTVVAEDVFIPGYRTLPLPNLIEAKYPERHNSDGAYFNLPLAPVLVVNAGGTPLGIARGAQDAFFERMPGRGITYTNYTVQSEAPITHLQVGEAALKIDSCDAHVRRACELLDDHPGGPMTLEARVASRAHIGYATGLAREAVDTLFAASGASAIQTHVPIQRFQRDIQALSNHAVMSPSTAIEMHGRVLCGLEPHSFIY